MSPFTDEKPRHYRSLSKSHSKQTQDLDYLAPGVHRLRIKLGMSLKEWFCSWKYSGCRGSRPYRNTSSGMLKNCPWLWMGKHPRLMVTHLLIYLRHIFELSSLLHRHKNIYTSTKKPFCILKTSIKPQFWHFFLKNSNHLIFLQDHFVSSIFLFYLWHMPGKMSLYVHSCYKCVICGFSIRNKQVPSCIWLPFQIFFLSAYLDPFLPSLTSVSFLHFSFTF